ncbi:molybdenum cofactor guanylyltransferase [Paenibacillus gorillae]|uniref:molybdenum cofactor guanylyltransferase n=1 Tax=Paenibacillus gorillae TaxID=1243662 RepID=UPI002351CB19|nr:molybdenum cofactor guanylyltransferase [Paenibacillus gorillae]
MDGIILAGGQSRRMNGKPKALLPFGGSRMLERLLSRMSPVCGTLTVVAGTSKQAQAFAGAAIHTLVDRQPQQGPLAALHLALEQSNSERLQWVTACDMPFLSAEAAVWMQQRLQRSGSMAVVPEIGGKLHPLQAIYRPACASAAATCLEDGSRGMMSLFHLIDVEILKETDFVDAGHDIRFAFNMNTPADYTQALMLENEMGTGMEGVCR